VRVCFRLIRITLTGTTEDTEMRKELTLLRLNCERRIREHRRAGTKADLTKASALNGVRIQVMHILGTGRFGVSILRADEVKFR
jgi:hypothetical protein